MKKKSKYIVIAIFIIEVFIGIALFFHSCSSNSILVKNVYGEQQLSPEVLQWKLNQEKTPGVHLYMQNRNANDACPIILYYNGPFVQFINEGIGVITDVQASESNNTLKIWIEEVSFPTASLDNKATAILILRKEPKNIEVFLEGEKIEYTLDRGKDPVFNGALHTPFY